jgi:antitoxin ParD1/3/4
VRIPSVLTFLAKIAKRARIRGGAPRRVEDAAMATMNISLPEPMKQFVEEQVGKGGYASVSEYLRELIRDAQRRAAKRDLEAKLLEGMDSPAREMTPADWDALRRRVYDHHPELRDRT